MRSHVLNTGDLISSSGSSIQFHEISMSIKQKLSGVSLTAAETVNLDSRGFSGNTGGSNLPCTHQVCRPLSVILAH